MQRRWILIGGSALCAGAVVDIASTQQYAACSNASASLYTDDLNPSLLEYASSFFTCEKVVFASHPILAVAVLVILAACSLAFLLGPYIGTTTMTTNSKSVSLETSAQGRANLQREGLMTNSVPSIISASVAMAGTLKSTGDFQIDGAVDGDIQCAKLVIAESGQVTGDISAECVQIRGRFKGTIFADRVILNAGSYVQGSIFQNTLEIESGARFEGDCRKTQDHVGREARVSSITQSARVEPLSLLNTVDGTSRA